MRHCRSFLVLMTVLALSLAPLGVARAMQDKLAPHGAHAAAGMEHCEGMKQAQAGEAPAAAEGKQAASCCDSDPGCEPDVCAAKCLAPYSPPVSATQALPATTPVLHAAVSPAQPPAWTTGLLSPPPRS